MTSPSNAQVRRVGPPKTLKWVVAAMAFLGGPGLLAFGGTELVRRHNELTQTATATVVDIKIRDGSESKLHCAIYEWEHEGRLVRTEAPECKGVLDAPTVGQKIAIRYAPNDVETPYPDTFWGVYGMAVPVGIAGGLFTAFFIFLVIPRREKPPTVAA